MGCRAHFNISKISKNSLRSFLSRENRRYEIRVLSLQLQVIFDEHMNQIKVRLHNLCFAGLKLVCHSIINGLHKLLSFNPSGLSFIQSTFPLIAQSEHFHFRKASCCTPKFALALFHKKYQLQTFPDFSNWLKNRTNGLFLTVKQN